MRSVPLSACWLTALFIPPAASALVTIQRKFNFLPGVSSAYFGPISTGPCNATLAAYDAVWSHAAEDPAELGRTIFRHQECMLENMPENIKATMASASIMLGLTPVLLQAIGPSVSEVGMLSTRRPLLALMIALGTASVYPARIFSLRTDDARELVQPPTLLPAWVLTRLEERRGWSTVVAASQYAVVAVAIFNVMYTSLQLGTSTITNFVSSNSLMPLFWTLLPVAIHIPTTASFWLRRRRAMKMDENSVGTASVQEFRLCIVQEPFPDGMLDTSALVYTLHLLASVFSFLHGFVGVLIFSSLLFVEIIDAVIILLRYFTSVLACRAVLIFEISGMKRLEEKARSRATESPSAAPADTTLQGKT